MKLADTCIWIELLQDTPTGRRYRKLFDEPDQILVPTLVQFELRRWVLRERDEDQANRILAATRNCRIVPLTSPPQCTPPPWPCSASWPPPTH